MMKKYIKRKNPIKNKKDFEATIDELRNSAYTYLEKYSPSKQQLKTYLFKKFLKKKQQISNKKDLLYETNIGFDSSYFSPRSLNQTFMINFKS